MVWHSNGLCDRCYSLSYDTLIDIMRSQRGLPKSVCTGETIWSVNDVNVDTAFALHAL